MDEPAAEVVTARGGGVLRQRHGHSDTALCRILRYRTDEIVGSYSQGIHGLRALYRNLQRKPAIGYALLDDQRIPYSATKSDNVGLEPILYSRHDIPSLNLEPPQPTRAKALTQRAICIRPPVVRALLPQTKTFCLPSPDSA
jgi:hypothetical protein